MREPSRTDESRVRVFLLLPGKVNFSRAAFIQAVCCVAARVGMRASARPLLFARERPIAVAPPIVDRDFASECKRGRARARARVITSTRSRDSRIGRGSSDAPDPSLPRLRIPSSVSAGDRRRECRNPDTCTIDDR